MNINKNSWHYWLYSHTYKEGKIPVSTNLCQYVRRIVVSIPCIMFLAAVDFMEFGSEKIWSLLIAPLYTLNGETERYEIVIRPSHIIVILAMGYLFYHYTMIALVITGMGIGAVIGEIIDSRWPIVGVPVVGYLYWNYTIIMVTISALAIVVIIALIAIPDSEAWHIFKEYVKARKRKVCPLIEFREN